MNINCVICSDLLTSTGEVFSTQCGHIFHFTCLMHWIERSKTCPQCRNRCTEKNIHRIYFNITNTDRITEDVGTLQSKLENLEFQMKLKERDIKSYAEKYQKLEKVNSGLREHIAELNNKTEKHDSAVAMLKSKIVYLKSRSDDADRLTEELVKLKNKIKDMENVHIAINGTREQVNDMLRNENNIESLALLAATLKKSLLEADRRKRDMEHNLTKIHYEATRYRRECTTLENQNTELKKELHTLKSNYDKEKQYLKHKIIELDKKISAENNLDITNTSLKRIITESPVNFHGKLRLTSPEEDTQSPSMAENVQNVVNSESPYLPVKTSNITMDYTSLINPRLKTKSMQPKSGFSIFRQPPTKLENMNLPSNNGAVNYDGLGGSSKDDIFPSPKKPAQISLKRHKSSSSVSSSKFRKLAPTAKVSSFLSSANSQ